MKKIYLIWVILFTSLSLEAQVGFVKIYEDTIGGTNYKDAVIDEDTIVVYGLAFDTLTYQQGLRFVKLDTFGNVLSSNFIMDTSVVLTTWQGSKAFIRTTDGGYAMMGSLLTAAGEMYLLKLHHDLSLDFIKMIPLSITTSALRFLELPDGYLIAGTDQYPGLILDPVVLKIDKQANVVWRKSYGTDLWEDVYSIKQLSDNEFVVLGLGFKWNGVIGDYMGPSKGYALHIDSVGNELEYWQTDDGVIWDIAVLPDSSWICLSNFWVYNPTYDTGDPKAMLFRLDKNKNLMWRKDLATDEMESWTTAIAMTKDSNYIVSGILSYDDYRIFHLKIDPAGDSLWVRQDTLTQTQSWHPQTYVQNTLTLSTGSIITLGYTKRHVGDVYGTYGFVMKLSPDGCIDTLNCWPVANNEPFAQAKEVAVYPNPFGTYLTVNLPDYPKNAYIYFFDITGRFLRKERVRHGANELDVGDFPKGMVFYEVRDGVVLLGRGKVVRN